MDRPHSHALRRGRRSQAGQVYLITFVTAWRRPLFADWEQAAPIAAILGSARTWESSHVLSWVLMPDHWHGLIELQREPGPPLHRVVARAKALASRGWAAHHAGPLWQRSFHDHAVRREESLIALARYLVANPLRAGLVERVGDYPYWNAVWL